MALLGTLLKKGIRIREMLDQEYTSPFDLQKKELKELLIAASQTEFGSYYNFQDILGSFRKNDKLFFKTFQNKVPIHNYNKIYNDWWKLELKGVKNICWPGRIKYFALSSGTSEASSKYIPVTKDMTKAIQKTSLRQILTLSKYDLPPDTFTSGILMLGGSTHLNKRGSYFEGDLSGIQAARLPFWFQHFYKPGKKIAKNRNWDEKLNEITRNAPEWNIGVIVGVPAWIQILMEKIIAYHNVKNIHDIWPNLRVYVHGGVSFDPYKKGFEKLLGRPIHYIETYLASEGFMAFQAYPNRRSMRLVLNNGIFYEFVPFEDENFDAHGEIKAEAKTLMIDEVEEGKEYAILLSTCAGAWRYIIGDVIKFTSVEESEIVITGRTKHFLSLCGEHLSVDNMNKAIELVSNDLNINIKEFTVAGIPYDSLFAHHWFIGTDDKVDKKVLRDKLDGYLQKLNDDYAVERSAALKDVNVDVLPVQYFYDWMEHKGKVGGQNKFPRVMKKYNWKNGNRFYKPTRMEIVLKGIISGLVLALMIGPVFFTIIQTSIERGFHKGVLVAIGVSLSDILYITVSYLGLSQIIHNERLKIYLTYGGGIMLLGFGCYYLFIKSKKLLEVDPKLIKSYSPWRYVGKGFIINGLTPMMLIFWIGTVSVATTDLGYHAPREAFLFFTGIVCTVFITDIIKAKLADQLRHLLTSRLIHILNITLGIVLIIFGLRLLFFTNQIW